MAIDKRTFKGGMNKDIDQRLIPDDQYREATNVQNLHGADGTLGVITPISGNIKKGAAFSFTDGAAQGGKLIFECTRAIFNWTGSNIFKFDVNLNVSNGTTSHQEVNSEVLTHAAYIELYNNYPQPNPLSDTEIQTEIFTNRLYTSILETINGDSDLVEHLSVEIVNNTITITALQVGYGFIANTTNSSNLIYLDDYTSPVQSSANDNDVFSGVGSRIISQSIIAPIIFDAVCVGVVNDEDPRKIYYFVTQTEGIDKRDWILMFSEASNSISIIYSELKSKPSSVLNFNKSDKIHSINVIDSKFLAWTDNNNTPKRINIQKCYNGYYKYTNSAKAFIDNNSAPWSSSEFVDVSFEGNTNGLYNKLTFVGESDFNMEVRSHKGVRVAPSKGDFEPIIIENENVYVEVEWDSFIIRDKRDMNNEPRLRSDKATDAKKLHKLISSNKSEFDNSTFQNFHTLFTNQYDNKKLYVAGKYNKDFIGFHFWCAID